MKDLFCDITEVDMTQKCFVQASNWNVVEVQEAGDKELLRNEEIKFVVICKNFGQKDFN